MNRSANMQSLLERYALLALEKQDRFSLLVGDYLHELDLDAGMVRFTSSLAFPFQVLGTESDNTLTWLWSWAEEHAEVSPDQLSAARALHAWGIREQVPEFISPSVDLDKADGAELSMISSIVADASCFFEEAYDGGSVFLLLSHPTIDNQQPFDRVRLLRRLEELAVRSGLNQRNALLAYLRAKEIPCEDSGDSVTARLWTGERLNARFDGTGRYVSSPADSVG